RLDADLIFIESFYVVELIIECQGPGPAWFALPLIAAFVPDQLQGIIGMESEGLRSCCLSRALGRRGATLERNVVVCPGKTRFPGFSGRRAECDPVICNGCALQLSRSLIGFNLFCRRQSQVRFSIGRLELNIFQQLAGIDALVKCNEEEWAARMRPFGRVFCFDLQRWSRESPSLRRDERATRCRFRSGWDFDRIVGRHRETILRL